MLIAEIGLNHMGNEDIAIRMLKKTIKKDVDAITFQIANPSFYTKDKPYKIPLSKNFYKKAIAYAHKNNKLIGFAIADTNMVSFLDRNGADFYKTLSFDISNCHLHDKLQKTGKITYVSTGISSEKEIIKVIKNLKKAVLIHTQLSHKIEDTNLKAISRLRERTKKMVAFGLHCSDTSALYLALAFEPSDIFFYIKESPKKKYPDDEHAIPINKLDNVLRKITYLKKALGDGIKRRMKLKIK